MNILADEIKNRCSGKSKCDKCFWLLDGSCYFKYPPYKWSDGYMAVLNDNGNYIYVDRDDNEFYIDVLYGTKVGKSLNKLGYAVFKNNTLFNQDSEKNDKDSVMMYFSKIIKDLDLDPLQENRNDE